MAGRRSTTNTKIETVETNTTEKSANTSLEKENIKYSVRQTFEMNELVVVRNATQGKLVIYDSDGFANIFDGFGYSLEMEYKELLRLKKQSINMFKQNYIEISPVVAKSLGVDKFYQNTLSIDSFDEIFELDEIKLKQKILTLNDSTKRSIGLRAVTLIENGQLDSLKKIKVLEDVLGYKLIEE